MARKIVTSFVDDLDDTPLTEDEAQEVVFSLDGTTYKLDLSAANAAKVRDTFGTYVQKAQRVTVESKQRARANRPNSDRERAQKIRAWAIGRGMTVPARGRIPGSIVEAYEGRSATEKVLDDAKAAGQQTITEETPEAKAKRQEFEQKGRDLADKAQAEADKPKAKAEVKATTPKFSGKAPAAPSQADAPSTPAKAPANA